MLIFRVVFKLKYTTHTISCILQEKKTEFGMDKHKMNTDCYKITKPNCLFTINFKEYFLNSVLKNKNIYLSRPINITFYTFPN